MITFFLHFNFFLKNTERLFFTIKMNYIYRKLLKGANNE